jgi:hypothetical protein
MSDHKTVHQHGVPFEWYDEEAKKAAYWKGEADRIEAECEGFRLEAARWRREADAALESEKRIEADRDRLRDILDSPLGRATFPQALEGTSDE